MGKWMHQIFDFSEAAPEAPDIDAGDHISAEDLARMAQGAKNIEDRDKKIAHLNRCPICFKTLSMTLEDLSSEEKEKEAGITRRQLYAIAASLILFVGVGGGLFFKYLNQKPELILATLNMDAELRHFLMENEGLVWEGKRAEQLGTLLRERGVDAENLRTVRRKSPYTASKGLFVPKEVLEVRIEGDTAYLEVIERKEEENKEEKKF